MNAAQPATVAEVHEAVRAAVADRTPVVIRGAGTKQWLGGEARGAPLALGACRGVVDYQPTELVVTVLAGTPLAELERVLAQAGQMLASDPPRLTGATVGGALAAGWSGPSRPFAGSLRDAVLGVRCINGRGELLRFGGTVMKNVAGFDLARLMAGSLGTLAVITELSLRVTPRPRAELTVTRTLGAEAFIAEAARLRRQPLPMTGLAWVAGQGYLRLAGTPAALASAADWGEPVAHRAAPWSALRDLTLPVLREAPALWRVCVPPATPPLRLPGPFVLDWGGGLRWHATDLPAARVIAAAAAVGGHATRVRGGVPGEPWCTPRPAATEALMARLRRAFDPHGLLNPGRMG